MNKLENGMKDSHLVKEAAAMIHLENEKYSNHLVIWNAGQSFGNRSSNSDSARK